ncbi:MAG: uL13 family ribosomal protein, partial [Chloroflexota bacterium]|nr:uL13 family ribosomal protein [Chloroflexota bacterium]
MSFRSFTPRPGDADERWWVVDAEDQILGRLATRVAVK